MRNQQDDDPNALGEEAEDAVAVVGVAVANLLVYQVLHFLFLTAKLAQPNLTATMNGCITYGTVDSA